MIEEPVLSRQCVLRRLQRALTTDQAVAALEHGVASAAGGAGADSLTSLARASDARVATLRELIAELGSRPYSSIGLARGASRIGGYLLGFLGTWAWGPSLRRISTHVLSEYDVLVAFVDHAPGVDGTLVDRLRPLLESARRQHEVLR